MANTKQEAALAAKDDKKQTGPAGLPGTKPGRQSLTPEQRAAVKAKRLADHERLLDSRVQNVNHFLADMGVASLAGRISEYTDVSQEYAEACLVAVEERIAKCRAALKARAIAGTTETPKTDLRALAARIQAERQGATVKPTQ